MLLLSTAICNVDNISSCQHSVLVAEWPCAVEPTIISRYANLPADFIFQPLASETHGATHDSAQQFLCTRVSEASWDVRESTFLWQKLCLFWSKRLMLFSTARHSFRRHTRPPVTPRLHLYFSYCFSPLVLYTLWQKIIILISTISSCIMSFLGQPTPVRHVQHQ